MSKEQCTQIFRCRSKVRIESDGAAQGALGISELACGILHYRQSFQREQFSPFSAIASEKSCAASR